MKTWATFSNQAVAGILRFAHEHGGYEFRDLLWSEVSQIPRLLRRIRPAGAIMGLNTADYGIIADRLPERCPLVSLGADTLGRKVGVVCSEDRAIVQITLKHLRSVGYEHIGFVGWDGSPGSARRAKLLKQKRPTLRQFDISFEVGGKDEIDAASRRELRNWICEAPLPFGVIAWAGPMAMHVRQVCEEVGRSVPGDVGILSLADDQFCLFGEPPLSALDVNGEELGYQSMALLASMLEGEPAPRAPRMVPPKGVVERASTGRISAPEIDELEAARHFIELNACRGITVEDVVTALPNLSRTRFYEEFTERMGAPPAEYIRRVKIERAQELLSRSRLSITRIAGMSGFNSATQFGDTFKREVGMLPLKYRRTHQHVAAPLDDKHKRPPRE